MQTLCQDNIKLSPPFSTLATEVLHRIAKAKGLYRNFCLKTQTKKTQAQDIKRLFYII